MKKNNIGEGKAVKKKESMRVQSHEILDKPIFGGILMSFYAFVLYEVSAIPADENETLASIFGILCCIVLLVIHRLWFRPELKSCISFDFLGERGLMLVVLLFFIAVLAIWIPGVMSMGFAAPTPAILIEALAAAFCEEVSFRVLPLSVMMRTYKDKDTYLPALILPAILFGLIHLVNLYGGGDVPLTILQVFCAAFTGMFFAAIYLRTGSLVPSFLIHFLYDFIAFMQAAPAVTGNLMTSYELIGDLILALAEIILVIALLRGRKQEIMQVWKKVWSRQ